MARKIGSREHKRTPAPQPPGVAVERIESVITEKSYRIKKRNTMSEIRFAACGDKVLTFAGVDLYDKVTKVDKPKHNTIELGKLDSGFIRFDASLQGKKIRLAKDNIYATKNGVRCLCFTVNERDCLIGQSQIQGTCHLLVNDRVGDLVFKCNIVPKLGYEYTLNFTPATAAYMTAGEGDNKKKLRIGDPSTGYDVVLMELTNETELSVSEKPQKKA